MNNKQNIINQFTKLLKQKQVEFDMGINKKINLHKIKAIKNVIKQLEKYDNEITSAEQLSNIEGIGKNSLKRIDEIIKTGKLSELKDIDDNYLIIIEKLETVFGIGHKKAYELVTQHNITSIQDLETKLKSKEISLPENIIKGIKYLDKIKENIPHNDITYLDDILVNITLKIDPHLYGITCGSYRRQKPTSNDIDFILVHSNIKTKNDIEKNKNYLEIFISKLKKENILIESLTSESVKTKYMGICKIHDILRRIDIRYMPFESYYTAILYFTGSKDFNIKMRNIAHSFKYTLNEYGLYDENNKAFIINSEKDIFDLLNMEFIPPNKR